MHNFNVMALAHKQARKLVAKRPMPYRCALGAALVLCHAHAKRVAKLGRAGTVRRNTHELKEGEIIRHYGCLFKLKNKRRSNCHDDSEVYIFDTVCLGRTNDSQIPMHWINREGGYTIQGNERATWGVVVE
ncbi:hypothetical protein KoPa4_00109 [Pseudomonas phage vB_PpuM-KoPa-4]|uniref:Uncharacterized protein n=1 Tax=Pseudomonas phage vB_PpuM-KoPa-4 TaxID=3132618 RepID=A0AAX4MXY3_9CAUD